MTIPTRAVAFAAPMDPTDEVDWIADFSTILEDDESVTDYTLTLPAESVALGLTLMSGGGRDHGLVSDETALLFWLEIADAYKSSPYFDGQGTRLPIEVTIVTNSAPARTLQRTMTVLVVQQ